nr:4Fe-4S ferredoxin [Ktedonobacterales bacterium]
AYGQLVESARTQIERAVPRPLAQRLLRFIAFDGLLGDLGRFRRAGALLRLYQRSGPRWLARRSGLLDLVRLRAAEALLPELPAAFVVPAGQVYPPPERIPHRGRVALFAGCAMSTVFAATDRATIRVLTLNGYEVALPPAQQCCGALTVHSGDLDRGRMLACRNILAFEASGADTIVVNAAGCGAALKEYGRLFAEEPAWRERAEAFAARVRDVTELLGALHDADALNTRFAPLPLRATYQEACHLVHAQRISAQPRALLRAIPGLELVEMEEPALCCGSAGVYNLTRPAMAGRLGTRKVRALTTAGARVVVTANPGCALHLRAQLQRVGSSIAVAHVVDVLDAAYRGARL